MVATWTIRQSLPKNRPLNRARRDKLLPGDDQADEAARAMRHMQPHRFLHRQLRKIIKTRGHFPTDEAATKLIWLALRNITADWGCAAKDWKEVMNQFAILYADRFVRLSV